MSDSLSSMSDADLLASIHSDLATDPNSPAGIAATAQSMAPHSLGQKLLHGLGDTALGALETVAHYPAINPNPVPFAPTVAVPSDSGDTVSNIITNREQPWQANRAANNDTGVEWARLGGQALGAAPAMALLPESAPGVVGGLMGGALQGGAAALMQPVGNTPDGYGAAKLNQIEMGTGTGGLMGGILGWLGGKTGGQATQNDYRDAVNFLRDRDVTPTIGQTIGPNAATWEDKLSTLNLNVPGAQKDALKSFNVAALNEALQPLGMSYNGPIGRDAFQKVGDVFDRAYDAVKSQISLPVSDDLRTNIGQIISNAATPDISIAKTTQSILDKALYNRVNADGILDGAAFKAAEEDIGKYAQRYTGTGATATERGVGEALQNIQGALRNSLENANPAVAGQLRSINRGYAILSRVRDAVPVGNPDGIFTPFQLASAVSRADNSAGGMAYAEGNALLQKLSDAGLRVLGNKFPDSGTAGRVMNADPFALAMQAGITIPTYPAYSRAGTALIGGAINAAANAGNAVASNAAPLMGSAARGAQKITPYLMPGLLGMVRGSSLMGQ
jgi:hypothetical protein